MPEAQESLPKHPELKAAIPTCIEGWQAVHSNRPHFLEPRKTEFAGLHIAI